MSIGDHQGVPDPGADTAHVSAYGYGTVRDHSGDGSPGAPSRSGRRPWTIVGAVVGLLVLVAVGAWVGRAFFSPHRNATVNPLPEVPVVSPPAGVTTSPTPSAHAPSASATPPEAAAPVAASDMAPGTCFADPYSDAQTDADGSYVISGYSVVPCTQAHYGEVFLQTRSAATGFDADALVIESSDLCYAGFAPYVGTDYASSSLYMDIFTPTQQTWQDGNRAITCTVMDPAGDLTVPVRGSGR